MSKLATRRRTRDPAPPRKKACTQCTKAKVRCGLEKPTCRRCQSRDVPCGYFGRPRQTSSRSASTEIHATESEQPIAPRSCLLSTANPGDYAFLNPGNGQSFRQELQNHNAEFRGPRKKTADNHIDFRCIDLIPVTDSASIRNRWLQSFLPDTGQRAKILPLHTVQYLSCVFGSYSRQLLRPGCFPPFIHPLQIGDAEPPLSLANCFSLLRMWVGREYGSDVLIAQTVKSEMQRLFDEVGISLFH
jgi:Fungal Zn(2)-Cys(6) binuclear cluster domain